MSPAWRVWVPLVVAYGLSLAFSWPLLDAPPTPFESFHYAVARQVGQEDPHLTAMGATVADDLRKHVVARPLYYAIIALPAQSSFESARLVEWATASAVPALILALLGVLQVRPEVRYPIAAFAIIHPTFATAGMLLPAGLMTPMLLAAVLAERSDHPRAAGALLAAALWTDRLALPAGILLLAGALRRGALARRTSIWPLRTDALQSSYVLALLGSLPLVYAGGPIIGFSGTAPASEAFLRAVVSPWLVPFLAVGLAWPRSRLWSSIPLLYGIMFAAAGLVVGRTASASQFLPAAAFALVAAGVTVHTQFRSAIAVPRRRPWMAAGAGTLALLLILPTVFAAPPALAPGLPADALRLPDALTRLELEAGSDSDARIRLRDQDWENAFFVDVDWFLLYSFLYELRPLRAEYTYSSYAYDLPAWTEQVEGPSVVTVVRISDHPLNQALREVYQDCVHHSNHAYVLLDGGPCVGRLDRLRDSYEAHWRAQTNA